MATINRSTTVVMNGVSPISVAGTNYYQWFDKWLEGAFFWSPTAGPLLTVNMRGDWNAAALRVSGLLGLRIDDVAPGNRRLDAIFCRNDVRDVISLTNTAAEIIDTGGGHDKITVNGNFWVSHISAGRGNDVVTVNNSHWIGTIDLDHGRDSLVVNDRGGGVGYIKSLSGNDRIVVRSDAGTISSGDGNDVILTGSKYVDTIRTGGGHDRVTINGDVRHINGQDGHDTVTSAASTWAGYVSGGNGNDRLYIRGEADMISGGRGADIIGTGANWIGTIDAGRGVDRVILNKGGAEYINLGRDADTLIFKMQADGGHRVIVHGGGDVSGPGHRDSDTVNMSAFNVPIHADLNSGRVDSSRGRLELREIEHLIGGSRNDVLIGNHESNRLAGGAGWDIVIGGKGADTLIGGFGADQFRFRNDFDARADRILDFRRGQGDKIDLRPVDAEEGRGGNQRFDFIGQRRFSGDEGELRYVRANGETRIFADTDGDRQAELTIILDDPINMLMSDFFL